MQANYDVIVLGLGGVGSATAAKLAVDGVRVLGIDRYQPPHPHGSSHGGTRIIRKAYFEHPSYVPLLERAYKLWHQLESACEQQLYFATGLLQVGPADGEIVSGVRRSAKLHGLPIESMTMQQACERFPGLTGQPAWQAIFEADAGYLKVEECVAAHLQLASLHGANLLTNQPVRSWQIKSGQVTVVTDQQTYHASRLIIAAGSWASRLLSRYGLPLIVLRKYLYWYSSPPIYHQQAGFPCYFFDTPAGYFYGFPDFDDHGLKIARHSGGTPVDHPGISLHQSDDQDRVMVESFMLECMPQVERPMKRWEGCYYTMTPDQHFIVDRLPDLPNVVVVAGLSGHGFKFTSVLGELAAQIATDQQSTLDIRLFSLNRFLA